VTEQGRLRSDGSGAEPPVDPRPGAMPPPDGSVRAETAPVATAAEAVEWPGQVLIAGRPTRGRLLGAILQRTARWSLQIVLVALGAWVLAWIVGRLWVIVLPVLLGVFIAAVLWPPAAWLRRHGWPPALASATVVLAGLLVVGAVFALLAVSLTGGVPEVATSAASGIGQIRQWLLGPPLNLAESRLNELLQQVTTRLQQSLTTIATTVLTGVGAVASGVVTALLALVLAFLFVKDGPRFLPWLRGVTGPTGGTHLSEVLARVWKTLAGYIQTQAAVAFIDGVLIGIGLVIVGVPLALPLAVLTFVGGFIPIVGAIIAGALAVLVALVSNGFTAALIVLGIVLLVQQVEGNVLQPILQARSMKLHAAVVLLAVTAGGSLYGIAGAFLAVPVVAAVAVVLRYMGERISEQTGEGVDPDPGEEAGEPLGTTGDKAAAQGEAETGVPVPREGSV
jgi:putative heme transporter